MTDRVNAITVVLDKDYRDDDVEALRQAILHLKGVLSAEPRVTEIGDHIAQERVRHELGQQLIELIYPLSKR